MASVNGVFLLKPLLSIFTCIVAKRLKRTICCRNKSSSDRLCTCSIFWGKGFGSFNDLRSSASAQTQSSVFEFSRTRKQRMFSNTIVLLQFALNKSLYRYICLNSFQRGEPTSSYIFVDSCSGSLHNT